MTQLHGVAPGDLESVCDLLRAVGLPADGVADQFGAGWVLARNEDGDLIGVAAVERYGTAGLLRSVAVRPDWRGEGLGRALAANRIAWAGSQGLEALYLLTDTAAEYWPRFGFRVVGREDAPAAVRASVEWAHACPQSAVAMRRDLP